MKSTIDPMFQQSRSLKAGLLALAPVATLLALTGCGDIRRAEDRLIDPNTCTDSLPQEECERLNAEATREHLATAPRYASQEECEKAQGTEAGCRAANDSQQHSFLPWFLYYHLLTNNNGQRSVAPLYRSYSHDGTSGGYKLHVAPKSAYADRVKPMDMPHASTGLKSPDSLYKVRPMPSTLPRVQRSPGFSYRSMGGGFRSSGGFGRR